MNRKFVTAMSTRCDAMITHVEGIEEEYAEFTHADLLLKEEIKEEPTSDSPCTLDWYNSVKTERGEERFDVKQEEKDGEIQNTEQDDSPCTLDRYNSDLNLTINTSDCCSVEAMSSKASSNNINGHENIWLEIAQIL